MMNDNNKIRCKWEEPEILGYNIHSLSGTRFIVLLCKWEEPEILGYNIDYNGQSQKN